MCRKHHLPFPQTTLHRLVIDLNSYLCHLFQLDFKGHFKDNEVVYFSIVAEPKQQGYGLPLNSILMFLFSLVIYAVIPFTLLINEGPNALDCACHHPFLG